MQLVEAFAQYGAKLKNPMWSVCAQAPDGALVVSLWEHHFLKPQGGRVLCRDRLDRWSGAGNQELRAQLSKALRSAQPLRAVIAHTPAPELVDAGHDASKVPKTYSVRPDWIGRVCRIEGEQYEIEFSSPDSNCKTGR